jgi:membrane complex biogenesis BtpA family protein
MVPNGIIGVVHLPPLPGDPRWRGAPGAASAGFDEAEAWALRDAEALEEGGVAGLIVENFGSAPFYKGTPGDRVPPHQVAALARITRAIVARSALPVGVNCLRNDAPAAIGIAAAAGAAFVRVNVHAGAYVTDQGLIEGEAAHTLRYRAALGARVGILADVLVKHAAPLAPLGVADAVGDVLHRGLADAVVVTGAATGARVDVERLAEVARAAGSAPVLIGSGLTPALVDALAPLATGAIVGSWLKEGGRVERPVDRARVRALVAACAGRFRPCDGGAVVEGAEDEEASP